MINSIQCVNLGCGSHYIASSNWLNFDFSSNSKHVTATNLLNGIPLKEQCADIVYHSNILEHFLPDDAENFIYECYRILKSNGYIRIAVPDLEAIVREYIKNLEAVLHTDSKMNQANYTWILLELIDQIARNTGGGQMIKYWNKDEIINYDYLKQRVGDEFVAYRNTFIKNRTKNDIPAQAQSHAVKIKTRMKNIIKNILFARKKTDTIYDTVGKFRLGGEIHQWMYDRYSLPKLLSKYNFRNIIQVSANTTSIPQWSDYKILDTIGNSPRKPDSIFFEAQKQ